MYQASPYHPQKVLGYVFPSMKLALLRAMEQDLGHGFSDSFA